MMFEPMSEQEFEQNPIEEIIKDNKNDSSSPVSDLTDKDNLQKERDEYLDGWKRAKAELINYKNDELKRMSEVIRFAGEDIVRDMIVVLDSFDLCIASLNKQHQSTVTKGVYMIRSQIEDMLKRRGLERIIVSIDRQFDPALHEAIATVESDKLSGTIIKEIEKGYMWNGKLLRPARVVVAK